MVDGVLDSLEIRETTMSHKPRYGVGIRLLRDVDIRKAVQNGYIHIDPFSDDLVQPTSYDIRVSHVVGVEYDDSANSHREFSYRIEEFDVVTVHPRESVLFRSLEYFEFPPDMFAYIILRSTYARLLVSTSCLGHIECGWSGHLLIEIANLSSHSCVQIRNGDALATLKIYQLEDPPVSVYAKYLL